MATHDHTLLPPVRDLRDSRDFEEDERESVRSLEAAPLSQSEFETMAAKRLRTSAPRIMLRDPPEASSFHDGFHKVR